MSKTIDGVTAKELQVYEYSGSTPVSFPVYVEYAHKDGYGNVIDCSMYWNINNPLGSLSLWSGNTLGPVSSGAYARLGAPGLSFSEVHTQKLYASELDSVWRLNLGYASGTEAYPFGVCYFSGPVFTMPGNSANASNAWEYGIQLMLVSSVGASPSYSDMSLRPVMTVNSASRYGDIGEGVQWVAYEGGSIYTRTSAGNSTTQCFTHTDVYGNSVTFRTLHFAVDSFYSTAKALYIS